MRGRFDSCRSDIVDEVGAHLDAFGVEERQVGVSRRRASTTEMIEAFQQRPLRQAPQEFDLPKIVLQRDEQTSGLPHETPEVALVPIAGQGVLAPVRCVARCFHCTS
ncbi:hypothetical protein [Streptomyces sp. MZ04]|uniref:hypothetical protein n=1 Tax=Streptomyces sp. MZ04 TaxID=2559236 RepID=UPI001FD75C80|nr:hypothetical protein [Streptomyces sp. MZ04]